MRHKKHFNPLCWYIPLNLKISPQCVLKSIEQQPVYRIVAFSESKGKRRYSDHLLVIAFEIEIYGRISVIDMKLNVLNAAMSMWTCTSPRVDSIRHIRRSRVKHVKRYGLFASVQ